MSTTNALPAVLNTVSPGISTGDTEISIIDSGIDGSVYITTNSIQAMKVSAAQKVGIYTNLPIRRLDINDPAGQCLRLIRNNNVGTAIEYVDFSVSTGGTLVIEPSNGITNILAHNGSTTGLMLNNVLVRSTATQLNYLNITALGVAQSSRAMTLDLNGAITGITSLTATNITADNFYGFVQQSTQSNITTLGTIINFKNDGIFQFGNTTNGILSMVANTSTIYLQPSIDLSTGSAADLFIGNKNQDKTSSSRKIMITAGGNIGINTTVPTKRLEINSQTGAHIRLVNNVNDGTAIYYVDFAESITGDLTITSTGNQTFTSSNYVDISVHNGSSKGLQLGGVLITASATKINYVDVAVTGVAESSKALILDASRNINSGINSFAVTGLVANNITGTLITSAQPNITTTGIISNLKASGNIDLGDQGYIQGFLRITSLSQVVFIQPAITNSVGSASDLFIGNLNQTTTDSTRKFMIKSSGLTGIGTINPSKQLDINSSTGACLRLTYNNSIGTATSYADINVTATGDLSLVPSSGSVIITSHNGSTSGLVLGATLVTTTAAKLNYNDIATLGIGEASKTLTLNASRDISNINNITATNINGLIQTAAQPGITSVGVLTGLTVSTTDLNNTILYPVNIIRTTNTAAAVGSGVGINFGLKSLSGSNITYGTLSTRSVNVGSGSESGKMVINLLNNGAMDATFTFGNDGLFTASASVSEGSDSRIKSNITHANMQDSFNKIQQINVMDYTLNADQDQKIHRGIIAQELLQIIPNAIHKSNLNGLSDFHTVENREVLYHLIQAVQYIAKQLNIK